MAPELQVLAINAGALAVAYLGIFPALRPLTLMRLALADLGVGLAALATSGALFWGSGAGFGLLLVEVNWFVFALLTLMAMEYPVLRWFARRHGIRFGPGG
jgi:hypothetical protein